MNDLSIQLRNEIEIAGRIRRFADIMVEPRQYVNLARMIVGKLANLYCSSLEAECEMYDLNDLPSGLSVIVANSGDVSEFCAVRNGRLIAAGYGADYDCFHALYFAGHESSVGFVVGMLEPGESFETNISLRERAKLGIALGIPIAEHVRASDGRPIKYALDNSIKVTASVRDISFPSEMNIGTSFESVYTHFEF